MSSKRIKVEKHIIDHHKAWLFGLSTAFIIAVGILYVLGSLKAWQNFDENSSSWYRIMSERSSKVLQVSSQGQSERSKKQIEFDELYTTIEKDRNRCDINPLFLWQQSLENNRGKVESCQQKMVKVQAFGKALRGVAEFLKSEKDAAAIISEAAKTGENLDESAWPEMAKKWTDGEERLRQLAVVSSFATTKQLAMGKLQSIHSAWSELISASQAKDRSKYEQADAKLTQAYGTMDEIAQAAETRLIPLISELEKSYDEAYKRS